MNRFRGGLVFKAHRLVYHSSLGLRVIKKKKKSSSPPCVAGLLAVRGRSVPVECRGGGIILYYSQAYTKSMSLKYKPASESVPSDRPPLVASGRDGAAGG